MSNYPNKFCVIWVWKLSSLKQFFLHRNGAVIHSVPSVSFVTWFPSLNQLEFEILFLTIEATEDVKSKSSQRSFLCSNICQTIGHKDSNQDLPCSSCTSITWPKTRACTAKCANQNDSIRGLCWDTCIPRCDRCFWDCRLSLHGCPWFISRSRHQICVCPAWAECRPHGWWLCKSKWTAWCLHWPKWPR